jgi:hypothetical protein
VLGLLLFLYPLLLGSLLWHILLLQQVVALWKVGKQRGHLPTLQ